MPDTFNEDEILKEVREFHAYATRRWAKNRREADEDMRALSVEGPWPQAELDARKSKENPRPHGHTDIISPYNNRIVNQFRMNPRGVNVIPKGDGASEETANLREDRIRGISYDSHGAQARLTALQNAVDRGVGYWRVDTEFESPRSRNLKIVVRRIPNPNAVLDDPDCQEADRSDRKKLIIGQWIPISEAKQRWKNLKEPSSFPMDQLAASASWLRQDQMFFAEFWKVEKQEERLFFFPSLSDGCFESELEKKGLRAEDAEEIRPNEQDPTPRFSSKIFQYFTNGLQVFEKKPWPGSWIPFPTCVGREKYEGDELVIESLTRKLREPQLNFDVSVAGEMEQFGMSTKSKIMVSDLAISGYEDQWKLAHRNPQAYLKYHERDEQGQPVQQPREIAFQAQIDGYEVARNSFIRDSQNAAGMTGIDQKQRQSESGVAQDKIDVAADTNNFHFNDSCLLAIEFEGRIENELLAIIEDSQRTVGLQAKDGKYRVQKITPLKDEPHPYGESSAHDVTIATGPDSMNQLQDAQEFVNSLVREPEFAMNPIAPEIVKLKNLGPEGDRIIKVLLSVQPPNVQAAYQEGTGDPQQDLPQALATIEQSKQAIQAINAHAEQLQQENIQLQDEKKGKVVENQAKLAAEDKQTARAKEIEQMKIDSAWQLQQDEQQFELERLKLEIQLERERNAGKMAMQSQEHQHETTEGAKERSHEAMMDAASQNGNQEND